jgi:hypothetical protein
MKWSGRSWTPIFFLSPLNFGVRSTFVFSSGNIPTLLPPPPSTGEKPGKLRHPTMGCAPSSRAAQTEFAGPNAAPAPFLGHLPNRTATTMTASQGDDIACETSQSSVSTVPAHARQRHTDYGQTSSWILAPTSNAAEADGDESVETPGSSVASPLGLNHSQHQAAVGFNSSPRPYTTFPTQCPGEDLHLQSTPSSTASIVAAQGYLPHRLTALARLHRVFPASAARISAKE